MSKDRLLKLFLMIAMLLPFTSALAGRAYSDTVLANAAIKSVEFIGMPAPSTDEERASAYTTASVIVTYRNTTQVVSPLSYEPLF